MYQFPSWIFNPFDFLRSESIPEKREMYSSLKKYIYVLSRRYALFIMIFGKDKQSGESKTIQAVQEVGRN